MNNDSEFFLRQLLDASVEGILAFDRDCRYTAWNRAMERISGIRSEDVLGKSAFDVFPFLKQSGEDKCFHAALRGESSTSDNIPFTVPETGRQGFFKGYYSPLRDQRNEIVGGIAFIHDITESKRAKDAAQEAHQRLTFHVENSPLAVIEWDHDARVSRWSESAERLFGWKAEEVLGKHVGDWHFVFDEDVDAVAQVTHKQRVGEELLGVQRNRNYARDGSILYCEWYNSVMLDEAGKMVSVLSLVLDVTARKLAEEERAALLAGEQDLRRHAEEADRLKDEFLATLSHELRTPLTSILGWATLIRTGDVDEGNVAHAIQIIERNARSQARLIDDLLNVSSIITGKLQLDVHPVNMAPLVEAANEALRPAADAKGIHVETHVEAGSCLVSGDPDRLRQVIWNLIMNAIKFTPRGGNVSIRLECLSVPPVSEVGSGRSLEPRSGVTSSPDTLSPPLSSCVRLTVSDTGEGINPEFLPYVFHRFRQEESSISRKAGGLGLGLAVARHLVELHGGTVSADSAGPGQGSTFVVELPVGETKHDTAASNDVSVDAATEPVGPAKGLSTHGELAGIQVLLVEDDEDSRILLKVLLKRRGAEVISFSSSSRALKWFTQQLRERFLHHDQDNISTPASGGGGTVKESALDVDLGSSRTMKDGAAQSNFGALPDIIISDLGMPDEDGYELLRKLRSLLTESARLTDPSSSSAQLFPAIPAIALTGYATAKDRERALSVGYQLHLAKPVEPETLVAAILSLLPQRAP